MFCEITMQVRNIFVLMLCVFIASCANTSITENWIEPDLAKSYKRPLIIAISDSQQTRRIFENHMVASLQKRKIEATPSYTIINSKQEINRETVINTIKGTDIDSVLVTYLVSIDTEMSQRESPLSTSYSGNVSDNEVSTTIITNRGRYSDDEIIKLKNDLYGADSKTIVWSVQTRSAAVSSIDEVVMDVTHLLIKQLFSDGVFTE